MAKVNRCGTAEHNYEELTSRPGIFCTKCGDIQTVEPVTPVYWYYPTWRPYPHYPTITYTQPNWTWTSTGGTTAVAGGQSTFTLASLTETTG